ncbi:Bax inhibitor-1/YccA family protein [Singulisphaera rosea]
MASSNPAFSNATFGNFERVYGGTRSTVMTVQGTVGKTFALLGILSATAIWSWNATSQGELQQAVFPGAMIGGFILAMITMFKPSWAPWTAPVYAAFEGVFLGMLSYIIEHKLGKAYPGIAIQAVSMTCGTLFCMLFAYGSGLIRVTEKLKAGIIAATGALCLVYFISFLVGMFGYNVPFIRGANPISIGFSVLVVGLAAFNLLLDFDFIEHGAEAQAPKYMEWYGAFGLIVTLVWLYLEILQLLRKLQDRR